MFLTEMQSLALEQKPILVILLENKIENSKSLPENSISLFKLLQIILSPKNTLIPNQCNFTDMGIPSLNINNTRISFKIITIIIDQLIENMNFHSFPHQQTSPHHNWEQLYHQLLFSYYQLSENYRRAVNQNAELTSELKHKQSLFKQTEKLFHQNLAKLDSKKTLLEEFQHQQENNNKSVENSKLKSIKKPRNHRKSKALISNQYSCTYPDCNRCYDSSVSLNLHIKLKHNGGTKKERQAYAKMIIDAEQKGQEAPKVGINFPPNFLDVIFFHKFFKDFRISYRYIKKYSM